LPYNPRVPHAPFLSLIIPAYNEERRLPNTLERVLGFLKTQSYTSELLVIENGSADRTFEVAKAFAEEHPGVSVHRAGDRGKGLAVRQGMLAAAGQYRMMLDADLSMPVEQVNRFLPPQQKDSDIVIASR